MSEDGEYRVEVKHRATGSLAYRWEIHREGNEKPVAASFNLFRSPEQALVAGRRALAKILGVHPGSRESEGE